MMRHKVSSVDRIERIDNRISVRLPEKLLVYVNEEAERRGLNPKKRSIILLEALSEKYNHEHNYRVEERISGGNRPEIEAQLVEALSERVAARALEKIELRIKKG